MAADRVGARAGSHRIHEDASHRLSSGARPGRHDLRAVPPGRPEVGTGAQLVTDGPTDTPETTDTPDAGTAPAPRRRRAAGRPAGPPAPVATASEPSGPTGPDGDAPATDAAAEQPAAKATAKKAAKTTKATKTAKTAAPAKKAAKTAKTAKTTAKKTATSAAAKAEAGADDVPVATGPAAHDAPSAEPAPGRRRKAAVPAPAFSAVVEPEPVEPPAAPAAGLLMFQAPSAEAAPTRSRRSSSARGAAPAAPAEAEQAAEAETEEAEEAVEVAAEQGAPEAAEPDEHDDDQEEPGGARRRRRRGGRGRRRRTGTDADSEGGEDDSAADEGAEAPSETDERAGDEDTESGSASSRRRRRRRRRAGESDGAENDPPNTVVRVREPRSRSAASEVTSVKGSTRLEAKKQRRREGREAGRRRPSILTEAEFLARREAVDRTMVVRQRDDRTQIAVLEDGVLVEHYVNRSTGGSMIGNVYLGRVQNVLPSMEAAFVDVGRGRNAVLYAGEVNWDAAGLEGQPKRIEAALKSGDSVLVQVTKDPLGHKGARLTAQISLPGRFLVYVPEGQMTGISRKLPDTERARLKAILRQVVPENAGVIVRTAAEGASEEELRRDVERLAAQWEAIQEKAKAAANNGPTLLHGEPDLAIKVVRDIFNEDFGSLVVEGDQAWADIEEYVTGVAPDLADRLHKWVGPGDLFTDYRIDEQLAKALDRKVWLPSGGSLVIDRTEAMTVVDVNTGKFTGQGGNLEETVTKNNLEAAEEIVRQLRLRDIGGIVVVDFIDMVLESNRDLVLRRLLECLGRDRTKHQVAEVTSLGLVQMTRKRIGQGLLEVFSEPCEHCQGRGYHVHSEPVVAKAAAVESEGPAGRTRKRRGGEEAEAEPARGGRRKRAAAAPAAPEVEPRAIDPTVSAAMEKVHAAAAKRAADAAAAAAAAAAGEPVDASAPAAEAQETPGTEQPAAPAAETADAEKPAAAAPARRTRGPRKATRKAGPAAGSAEAATPEVSGSPAG
ncbi:MAG: Rne/Rng family ribonuclease [Frankiales bacterium]|nr:Rne/Rng family ribonuclease [Frankiales bacterium]